MDDAPHPKGTSSPNRCILDLLRAQVHPLLVRAHRHDLNLALSSVTSLTVGYFCSAFRFEGYFFFFGTGPYVALTVGFDRF